MPIAINTEQIINKFSPLLHQQRNTYFVISLILTYYFASNLFLAIEYSLREIFHQELIVIKKRIFTKIIALPIFILFLFIIYFGGIFIYQIIKWLLKLPAVFQIIPKIFLLLSLNIAIIITFVTFFLLLFLVYHFIAPRRNKSLKNTIWATAIVGFFYTLLKVFFGNFITMISYINPIYGSFGSILIFLTWLFLTYNLVLIGARAIYYLELPDFKENLIA
jgi:membrane protein